MEDITRRLIESIKNEINTESNRTLIANDIIKPLINEILVQISPYIIGTCIFFVSMIISILIILFLNIRICFK